MMKENWPLVSVFTLCYNTGPYVIQALECVKRQNYPNIQHIILDDCSFDDSASQIAKWINTNNYKCTFIKHNSNRGIQKSLEEVFTLMEGKYWVAISDDLWVDNRLINDVSLFENLDKSYALIYGDTSIIDEENNIIEPSTFEKFRGKSFLPPSGMIFKDVLDDFFFYIQAAMIRKESFDSMNFSFSDKIISEDWYWQLHLSRKFKFFGTSELRAYYRIRQNSITQINWGNDVKKMNVVNSHFNMIVDIYKICNLKNEKEIVFSKLRNLSRHPVKFSAYNFIVKLRCLIYLLFLKPCYSAFKNIFTAQLTFIK